MTEAHRPPRCWDICYNPTANGQVQFYMMSWISYFTERRKGIPLICKTLICLHTEYLEIAKQLIQRHTITLIF